MIINNIAVCFYGQFRSGKLVVPYLKTLIDKILEHDNNINIDYFCSVKDSISYFTEKQWTKEKGNRIENTYKNDDYIADVSNFLKEVLNPKTLTIVKDKEIVRYAGIELAITGLADVLTHKILYEHNNQVTYDLVFLIRYDNALGPNEVFKYLVTELCSSKDSQHVWDNVPNIAIMSTQLHAGECGSWLTRGQILDDMFMAFTSSAADQLCWQIVEHIDERTSLYGRQTKPKYDNYTCYCSLHNRLHEWLSNCEIRRIPYPLLEPKTCQGLQAYCPEGTEIHANIVRDEPGYMDFDLSTIEGRAEAKANWGNM